MVIIMVEAQTISLRFSRRTHQPTYTKYAHQFIPYYLHSFMQVKEYELLYRVSHISLQQVKTAYRVTGKGLRDALQYPKMNAIYVHISVKVYPCSLKPPITVVIGFLEVFCLVSNLFVSIDHAPSKRPLNFLIKCKNFCNIFLCNFIRPDFIRLVKFWRSIFISLSSRKETYTKVL